MRWKMNPKIQMIKSDSPGAPVGGYKLDADTQGAYLTVIRQYLDRTINVLLKAVDNQNEDLILDYKFVIQDCCTSIQEVCLNKVSGDTIENIEYMKEELGE